MTRKIGRLINESAKFKSYKSFFFLILLYILYIHLHLTPLIKTPHIPDDDSAEPKRYSVDWLCFSINPYFLFGLLVVNFSSQIVELLSIIFFHSVPLTNMIQTHSPTPISRINNIKMFRRSRDLLKNKKAFITNFTQEKSHQPKCPAFFIHLNIFLDYISLCLETYIHILGFSLAYTLILITPPQIYMIWISSKTRNGSKSLELTERGFCTMFLMSGDAF